MKTSFMLLSPAHLKLVSSHQLKLVTVAAQSHYPLWFHSVYFLSSPFCLWIPQSKSPSWLSANRKDFSFTLCIFLSKSRWKNKCIDNVWNRFVVILCFGYFCMTVLVVLFSACSHLSYVYNFYSLNRSPVANRNKDHITAALCLVASSYRL